MLAPHYSLASFKLLVIQIVKNHLYYYELCVKNANKKNKKLFWREVHSLRFVCCHIYLSFDKLTTGCLINKFVEKTY